jgi:uncharacterized protein YwgA
VDGPARDLTTRDIVLLIDHAAGDTVAGRTVMQKLAYFVSVALRSSLGHRPHFYGPFSTKVEDAVGNAVLAGELHVSVERLLHWRGGPEVRKYTYDLTPAGKERVDSLIENNPADWDHVRDAVRAIREVLPSLEQTTLSSAAKTHLIISGSEQGVIADDIPSMAERLGWELDAGQVETTLRLLEELKLVGPTSEQAQ